MEEVLNVLAATLTRLQTSLDTLTAKIDEPRVELTQSKYELMIAAQNNLKNKLAEKDLREKVILQYLDILEIKGRDAAENFLKEMNYNITRNNNNNLILTDKTKKV